MTFVCVVCCCASGMQREWNENGTPVVDNLSTDTFNLLPEQDSHAGRRSAENDAKVCCCC